MKIGNNIQQAADYLKSGELVAIPTETVYGLAAIGLNPKSILKIFEAKNRPFFDPLILHTNSLEKIRPLVSEIPYQALALTQKFWPGPLTLLLPKSPLVPDLVCSGLPRVAVRIPDHPLTLELLSQLDFPVAAPSANPFGYVSPTSAEHVEKQLGNKVTYILNGGPCKIGVESTIIGFEEEKPVIYRAGGVTMEVLQEILPEIKLFRSNENKPSAPGQLKSHYAPLKKLYLGNPDVLLKQFPADKTGIISFFNNFNCRKNIVLSREKDLQEAAANLFSAIRSLDENEEVEIIVAEIFPDEFLGRAINDRLRRASHRETI